MEDMEEVKIESLTRVLLWNYKDRQYIQVQSEKRS